MNLAAVVTSAFAAVPSGITGSVTVMRTLPGLLDPGPDDRQLDRQSSMTIARAIVLPIDVDEQRDDGATQAQQQRTVLLPAAACTFVPAIGMRVTLGNGDVYIVAGVKTIDPSGNAPALYRCECRRG